MFAFYDYETTGISPAFDQPTQFAAILTDDDFNEIERVNLRCRLSPHILPAPWALAVTGLTPDMLNDPSLPTWFEFTQQVADLINRWAPATHIGYNTIAFDEEFHRQSFYQNLQPNLYLTQFNDNDRLDLMKVIQSVWVMAKDTLAWPKNEKAQISFKLDQLAPANGFSHDNAHDALADVEATIHLSKIIKNGAPHVWAECLRNRNKHDVNALLETGQPLRLVERFGAALPRSYIGAYAGRNPDNPNAVGFLDLQMTDPEQLAQGGDAAIANAVSATPKLIRTITVNKVPSLFTIDEPLIPAMTDRVDYLMHHPEFLESVGNALASRYDDRKDIGDLPLEQQIYAGGFYSASDRSLLKQFQSENWPERASIVESLADPRLRRLGRRIIHINAPDLVSPAYRSKADKAVYTRWHDDDNAAPWMTFTQVDQQLSELDEKQFLTPDQMVNLIEYYQLSASLRANS